MSSKEFHSEKIVDARDVDAESVISNGGPPPGKLVRQLKNRHIAMIR
jgi:hypothetical protein